MRESRQQSSGAERKSVWSREARLMKTRAIASQGNLSVSMEGRTAVLTGTVANEHARDLAARLCLLEPGVSKVENRLTIPEELTPPSVPAFAPPVPNP